MLEWETVSYPRLWVLEIFSYRLVLEINWYSKEVRHVPDIHLNLISTCRLDDEGFTNSFDESKWKLTKCSLVVAREK